MKKILPVTDRWFHQMFVLLLSIWLLLSQMNCHGKTGFKMNNKFDAPLRIKIQEMDRNKQDQPLICFVKLKAPIDKEKKLEIEKYGIKVITTIDSIILVEGKPDALREAAKFDFIQIISLSQENYPMNNK